MAENSSQVIEVIQGIPCYEKDGVAYLNLETVARGLGFVKKADSGNEVVNWTRVRGYLADLGVEQKCTTGDYIPENIFYRLAMKAKNETAEKFQALIADEVVPAIRKTGGYIAGEEHQKGNIMPKNLSPPAVHHQGRPKHSLQYQASMLKDAAAHVRLSPSAAALLVYYGTQAERFHPSLKLIERKTGISANKVSEKRKELVDHGLIFYVPGIMVAIRWEVIRIFALMLP